MTLLDARMHVSSRLKAGPRRSTDQPNWVVTEDRRSSIRVSFVSFGVAVCLKRGVVSLLQGSALIFSGFRSHNDLIQGYKEKEKTA